MAEGDEGRPMLAPLAAAGPLAGEAGRGEDYKLMISYKSSNHQ